MPSSLNPNAVIECVPNFSEGTDEGKVASIVAAMRVEGVRLLDWSLDVAHNRSVVTIAGPPAGVFGDGLVIVTLLRQVTYRYSTVPHPLPVIGIDQFHQ